MPDFGFSKEQERYRALVRGFAERELKPLRQRWDRNRKYPFGQMRKLLASHCLSMIDGSDLLTPSGESSLRRWPA